MTRTIHPQLNETTATTARTALAKELETLIGDTNRSWIQGVTAAAGHKITTGKLRKILNAETDPTLMDILAITAALQTNPIPMVVRTINTITVETNPEGN